MSSAANIVKLSLPIEQYSLAFQIRMNQMNERIEEKKKQHHYEERSKNVNIRSKFRYTCVA